MVPQYELKDASRIPLKDRLAWTIPQAASLYGIDYDVCDRLSTRAT